MIMSLEDEEIIVNIKRLRSTQFKNLQDTFYRSIVGAHSRLMLAPTTNNNNKNTWSIKHKQPPHHHQKHYTLTTTTTTTTNSNNQQDFFSTTVAQPSETLQVFSSFYPAVSERIQLPLTASIHNILVRKRILTALP
jgi:hypothetical protein